MRNILFIVVGCFLVLIPIRADESSNLPLSSLITEGPVKLDLMKIVPTPRATYLRVKMELALVEKRDWYLQYIKETANSGESLPYHSNFGLTEAEYKELMDEHKKRALVKERTVDAKIVISHNIARLEVEEDLGGPLSKLRVNLANKELTTEDGKVGSADYSANDQSDTPVGPWQGYAWKSNSQNEAFTDVSRMSLEVLRRKVNGRVIWVYSDSKMVGRELKRNYSITFECN